MNQKYSYFKIGKKREDWLGQRFFKMSMSDDKIVQVCVHPGELKKGRSNTFGVYLIARTTFFSNYLAMSYAIPCSQKEYEENFEQVIKYLK